MSTPTRYRSTLIAEPDGPIVVADVQPRPLERGEVRVSVRACGICHSDSEFVSGRWPGVRFPVTPGHEIAGVIEELGEDVEPWRLGDRVAVGWTAGHCGWCMPCRRGQFIYCDRGWVTGASSPGGYAEKAVVRASALARIPADVSDVVAAPLACAGVTMYNSLRHTGAMPGDTVAILGLGGLGHLGVQFAVKMGFRTVVIARGRDKAELAHRLGAHHYIDSTAGPVAAELRKLGGARVIQATAANSDAATAAVDGLALNGELVALGVVADPMHVSPLQLIATAGAIRGHATGSAQDIEDTLNFADLHGIEPMVEPIPFDDVAAGYRRMMANEARFRVVLTF